MSDCIELDCNREATRRGFCHACYNYRRRHGTLPPKPAPVLRVCEISDDECAGGYEGKGLCKRHYHRQYATGSTKVRTLRTAPDDVRYRANVDQRGPDECWPWTGTIVKTTGYGQIHWDGKRESAHRVAYELDKGVIPVGLQVDHTCHNRDPSCPGGNSCQHRRCQNPAHLEAVTAGVNLQRSPLTTSGRGARAETCPNGHEWNEENTYIHPIRGTRKCRKCAARYSKEAYERRRLPLEELQVILPQPG